MFYFDGSCFSCQETARVSRLCPLWSLTALYLASCDSISLTPCSLLIPLNVSSKHYRSVGCKQCSRGALFKHSAPPLKSRSLVFWLRLGEALQCSYHTEGTVSPTGRQATWPLPLLLPKKLSNMCQTAHNYSSDKNDVQKVWLYAEHMGMYTCVHKKARGQVSSIILNLTFLRWSATEPGGHWFGKTSHVQASGNLLSIPPQCQAYKNMLMSMAFQRR